MTFYETSFLPIIKIDRLLLSLDKLFNMTKSMALPKRTFAEKMLRKAIFLQNKTVRDKHLRIDRRLKALWNEN